MVDHHIQCRLKTLHLFLQKSVFLIELFVCTMDLQSLLNFFLHVVTVLFELTDDLLLGVGALFSRTVLFFQFFLQVTHLMLMALLHIRYFSFYVLGRTLLLVMSGRFLVRILRTSWLGSRAGIFAVVEQACLRCIAATLFGLFVPKMHP